MAHPFGRVTRVSLLQHLINLFERQASGFRHQEVRERGRQVAKRPPEEEGLRAQACITFFGPDKVRGNSSNDLCRETISVTLQQCWRQVLRTQFQNQLDEVERPTPRERMGSGSISPITTQAQGPQVAAKKEMLKQMKAIIIDTALLLFCDSLPAVTP